MGLRLAPRRLFPFLLACLVGVACPSPNRDPDAIITPLYDTEIAPKQARRDESKGGCKAGTFQVSQSTSCEDCSVGKFSPVDNAQFCTRCPPGNYSFTPGVPACHICEKGAICYGGTDIRTLPGWWGRIDTFGLANLHACPYKEKSCPGGPVSNATTCAEGYTGLLCGICATGYTLSDFGCTKCTPQKITTVGIILLAGIFLIVVVAVVAAVYFIYISAGPLVSKRVEDLFHSIDKDNSGAISLQELRYAIEKVASDVEADDILKVMEHQDADKSSDIDMAEFKAMLESSDWTIMKSFSALTRVNAVDTMYVKFLEEEHIAKQREELTSLLHKQLNDEAAHLFHLIAGADGIPVAVVADLPRFAAFKLSSNELANQLLTSAVDAMMDVASLQDETPVSLCSWCDELVDTNDVVRTNLRLHEARRGVIRQMEKTNLTARDSLAIIERELREELKSYESSGDRDLIEETEGKLEENITAARELMKPIKDEDTYPNEDDDGFQTAAQSDDQAVVVDDGGDVSEDLNGQFKILLVHLQIMGSLGASFALPWPTIMNDISEFGQIAKLDLIQVFGISCATPMSFFNKLVANFLLPFTYFSFLGIVTYLAVQKSTSQERVKSIGWQVLILLLFLIYPGTSMYMLLIFGCAEIDGSYYLRADISLPCYDSQWMRHAFLSILGILLYTIGIPFFIYLLLRRNRHKIYSSEKFKLRFGFIYIRYEPEFWFWELEEMCRKIVMVCAVPLISPGTPSQVVCAMLLTIIFFTAHMKCTPYLDDEDDVLAGLSQFSLLLTLLGAVMLVADETPWWVQVVLVLGNAAVFGCYLWILCTNNLPRLRKKIRSLSQGKVIEDKPEAESTSEQKKIGSVGLIADASVPSAPIPITAPSTKSEKQQKSEKQLKKQQSVTKRLSAKHKTLDSILDPERLDADPSENDSSAEGPDKQELQQLLRKMFERYNVDGSGEIGAEEARMLTLNMCYNLKLSVNADEMDSMLEKLQMSAEDVCNFKLYQSWFHCTFLKGRSWELKR